MVANAKALLVFVFLLSSCFRGRQLHSIQGWTRSCTPLRYLGTVTQFEYDRRTSTIEFRRVSHVHHEEKIKSFAIIYLVDVKEVPDFNTMYEPPG